MFDFLKSKVKEFADKVKRIVKKPEKEEEGEKVKEKSKVKKEIKKEVKKKKKAKVKLGLKKSIEGLIKGKIKIEEKDIEDLLEELELTLIQGDVAFEVAESIKESIKSSLIGKEVKKDEVEKIIKESIAKIVKESMGEPFSLIDLIKKSNKKPFVIAIFGTNGSGKTTTIAKLVKMLKNNNLSVVVAAADTFRAASIEQLEEHAKKLGFKIIKRNYGADPTSVAYDAVEHAKSKHIDVVIIDTAGRQDLNINLMKELEKIVRVIKPDIKLFVGESIAGSALYGQVKNYNKVIGIDGIILTKFDLDPKGGTVISAYKASGVPVIYLGIGQGYDDLISFNKEEIVKRLVE